QVRVFDPTGITGRATAKWSPLRGADSPTGANKAAAALAAAIPTNGVEGGMGFWTAQAELLLAGLLGTASLAPASMVDVAHSALTKAMPTTTSPGEILPILRQAADSDDPDRQNRAAAAALALDAVWRLEERVRSNIYATVQTVVKTWLDPAVAASATL